MKKNFYHKFYKPNPRPWVVGGVVYLIALLAIGASFAIFLPFIAGSRIGTAAFVICIGINFFWPWLFCFGLCWKYPTPKKNALVAKSLFFSFYRKAKIDVTQSRKYTEKEYITLYNYCVGKYNYQLEHAQDCIIQANINRFVNRKLEDVVAMGEPSPYHTDSRSMQAIRNEQCRQLLQLLSPQEQKSINWGILPTK
jgi:hypothetical protein